MSIINTTKTNHIDSVITNNSVEISPRQSGKQLKHPSYISRHWHGDLPLPISFWVNGFLLNLAIMLIMKLTPWDIIVNDSPRISLILLILFWFFFVPISFWQLVGIWNSSSNYIKNGKSKFVGNIVKFIIILNLINMYSTITKTGIPQIKVFYNIAIGNDPLGTYQIRVLRDATELEISGPIIFGLTNDVKKTLNAHPTIQLIHLNSIGGRVSEARKLRELIDTKKLNTYTSSGCSSACTLAFAAGGKRLIAKKAFLGFHQYGFPGIQKPDFSNEYEKDKRDWLNRGINRSFVEKAYTVPNNELWKPSHRELLEAGFITGYPENDEVAISGVQLKDIDNIENEIAGDPLYSAIKVYEPQIYTNLIAEIKTSFQKGHSLAEMQLKIRPYFVYVLNKRLLYGSDNALVEYIRINLEQMRFLYKIDPIICYNFIFGNDRDKLGAANYFSKELAQKEFNAISEIIRSSSIQPNQIQNEEQVRAQFMEILKRLAESYGDDVQLLSSPEMREMNKDRSCQLAYDLYVELLKLPQNEFGQVLRYLMAQGMK